MSNLNNTAQKTASFLLSSKAVKLNPNQPFQWASGWKSPIYCDNRVLLSSPEARNFIGKSMADFIKEKYTHVDLIAGVATGAIGIGMLVAHYLDLPFAYVRPQPKSHGLQNQIEGRINPGQNVVVIEDLISTGKSSINAVKALQKANVNVYGMLAIFSYGFKIADHNFKEAKIQLDTLSNYKTLLQLAKSESYIDKQQLMALESWDSDPENWHKSNL